jgi:hypothetical protein
MSKPLLESFQNKQNVIFVLPGNSRTFIECFDSTYNHIISKLFSQNVNIFIYFYLKLSDPGPKGQDGWNFTYKDNDNNNILDKINKIKNDYPELNIEYKIIPGNEISDYDLMLQIKYKNLYSEYINENLLLRGLHCHYNFERCGDYIKEKEKSIQSIFDFIIYIRPDLFFIKDCNNIESYNNSIITLAKGPSEYSNDHMAIIPHEHFNSFFFDRINLYRNNTDIRFKTQEEIYWHTIKYEVKAIGEYYINRP